MSIVQNVIVSWLARQGLSREGAQCLVSKLNSRCEQLIAAEIYALDHPELVDDAEGKSQDPDEASA